jgi:3-oxoacyl-[acyl-carrier protein] reductase
MARMDLGLAQRAYLVTGGTRGLGYATAQALVADGARVVVSGRSAEGVEQAADRLGGADRAVGVVADNADPDTPDRLTAAVRDRFGRLDGGLISVGGPPAGTPTAITDDQWSGGFQSVFLGAVRLARTLAQHTDPGGAIGFVLSTSVRVPVPKLAISNGLRPGLAMFAKDLADEIGPSGIRVFGLLPGRLSTGRIQELDQGAADPDKARQSWEEQIPLRRYGTPEEFGRVAAFLLSPAAAYVTGAMIPVDGGLLRTI